MADTESKKVMGNVWASDARADRIDPEDLGLTRSEGWPVAYEQIDSGFEPEREVFNQKMREWDGWLDEDIATGGLPQWDAGVNYRADARSAVQHRKYVALVNTGPAFGNAVQPGTAGAIGIWRLY